MAATMTKIGVIGAGQMGNGIAHVCALAGYTVLLNDVSEERVQAGLATIDGNLARQVASGRITRPTENGRSAASSRRSRSMRSPTSISPSNWSPRTKR